MNSKEAYSGVILRGLSRAITSISLREDSIYNLNRFEPTV